MFMSNNNSNIYTSRQNCEMKKNNVNWWRRKSDNVSFANSTNPEFNYGISNYNKIGPSNASHNPYYIGENSATLKPYHYRKNKQRKSKNFTFDGYTSHGSFRNHEPQLYNRKRKKLFQSNGSYINKKLKYNDCLQNPKVHMSNCESEQLNINKKLDIYNKASSLLHVEDGDITGSFNDLKKSEKNNDLGDCENGTSVTNSTFHKKTKEKEVPLPLENILNQDKVSVETENWTNILNNLHKYKKSQKHKDESLVDIRDSDCELSVYSVSDLEKRKKKKKQKRRENTNDIEHNSKKIEEVNNIISPMGSASKKYKKRKDVETLVDIRDSECEMSAHNVSNHKKKKVLNLEKSTSQSTKGDDEIKESKSSSFTLPKKSEEMVDIKDSGCELNSINISSLKKKKKKRQENTVNGIEQPIDEINDITTPVSSKKSETQKDIDTLVDIRDSDCELSVNSISVLEKRKKKKKQKRRENTSNDIEHINEKIEKSNNITSPNSSSPKKCKKRKDIETLVDIRDSECEMSVYDDIKETKSSSFKLPKKSKKMVDIRDRDCEVNSSNISSLKKKKKKRQENTVNGIKKYNDEQPTEELNDDTTTSVSSKKSKKQKGMEILDNNSDCDLSVDHVSNQKKKKKRHCIKEKPNVDESTAPTKNDSFVDHNVSSFQTPKTSKKKVKTLVDIRDSDCEMSFSNILSHKKKKKKKKKCQENSDDIQYDNKQINKEPNNDITILVSPKKLKKRKDMETLVDMRDSDCEMSLESHKKKKKKKNSIERDTPQTQNEDFNNGPEAVGETKPNSFSFKKEKKHQANTSFSDETKKRNKTLSGLVLSNKIKDHETMDEWDRNFGMSVNDVKKVDCESSFDDTIERKHNEKIINTCNADIAASLIPTKELKNEHNEVFASLASGLNDLSQICNASENHKWTDSSMQNVNRTENNSASNPLKGTRYKTIYSSSGSEGYQSDSSEIMIPMKNKKESCIMDEIQEDYTDKDLSPKISNCKAMISKFEEEFEEEDSKIQISHDSSGLLEIFNALKEETSEDDIETLIELNIVCSFPICQLHSIITTTTKLKKEVLDQIKELNLEVKTGPFSKEEDKMILNNWKTFSKEHNLTMNPSLFINFPRKVQMRNKVNFLRYLARGLDNRLLHRVHARFIHLVQSPRRKTGRFSAEEDETILNYIDRNPSGTPFVDLSELLNRTKLSIAKRYHLLSSDKNKILVKWTPQMVEKFLSCMMEVTKCDRLKQLKRKTLSEKEWKNLSKKMDNIPVTKLQRGWRVTIYPRLFAKQLDVTELKTIREDIIHNLYKRGETDWKLVNWKEVATDFEGFTPQKIYTMFKHIVNYHVPESKRENLKDCLDLLENIILKNEFLSTPHKFKRYIYEQGHVEYESLPN